VTPPATAVIVTLTVWLTEDDTALKPAVMAPAGTVTDEGTRNATLLLFSVTTVELEAAAVRYTEHAFVCGPVSDWVPHETLLRDASVVASEVALAKLPEAKVTPPHPHRAALTPHTASNTLTRFANVKFLGILIDFCFLCSGRCAKPLRQSWTLVRNCDIYFSSA